VRQNVPALPKSSWIKLIGAMAGIKVLPVRLLLAGLTRSNITISGNRKGSPALARDPSEIARPHARPHARSRVIAVLFIPGCAVALLLVSAIIG
jgi:hypothetical protein